ncbi:thioredoxin domain-containing protein [Sphingomonas sp. CROZ-RG-20F-R02-07]|uniref:DsbA family protein n=1 Tax=Sphingomonas sp. CROZ-RG-20F-R02-07 TaxID=2914832 RepID=UPI001F58364A|nr:thioredoxin domain-containing protein [Sphingomonas sp. CROZ-RG-20F-R02-07]
MKAFLALLALPLALAACSKGDTGGNAAPAAPVAAAAAPAGQDWTQTVSMTPEHGYVMGNPNAPIKLVEYGSRLCPTCGAFANTGMKPLENSYVKSGKVSYEFRDFMVHGAPDFAPALLGRCAGTAPFFPLLEQMFAAQPTILPKLENAQSFNASLQGKPPTQVSTAWAEYLGFIDFVKQRGIPEAQARACLGDMKQNELLATMTDEAGREKNVTGTPSFFLNGRKLDAVSWPDVEAQLKQAGA